MSTVTYRFSKHNIGSAKSCGGAVDKTAGGRIAATTALNELFDKVLKHENIAGNTEYRLIYLVNDGLSPAYLLTARILSSDDDEISIGGLAKNTQGEALSTEAQVPTGVVFKTQAQLNSQSGGYLSFENAQELAPGEYCGLWLKRSVNSSSGSGTKRCELVLEIKYRE